MSMLKTLMEELKKEKEELRNALESRKEKVTELEKKIDRLEADNRDLVRLKEWEIEKAKHELRKEMEKDLIESDLKRVEAIAKLNTYIEMDTKDERKHIQQMLEKAIEALGKQQVVINK